MRNVRVIYGIDFSGAQDAGNKIWIAKGIEHGKGLLITECRSASDLTNSAKGIEGCLPALVKSISSSQDAVFRFDFPFGLPAPLVDAHVAGDHNLKETELKAHPYLIDNVKEAGGVRLDHLNPLGKLFG